jgi:hypothetical protein
MKKETKSLFEVFDTEGKEVIKITSGQVAELIADVFINGGYHEKLDIENEIKDNGYMENATTLEDADNWDFNREAEKRGYVEMDDVASGEHLEELVKTHSKRNSAIDVWKTQYFLENINKISQEDLENLVNK